MEIQPLKTLTNYLGLTASNVSNTLKLHDIIAQNDVLLHIEPPQYFILWGRRAGGGGGGGFLKKVLNYHINLNKIGSGGIAPNKKKSLEIPLMVKTKDLWLEMET